MKGIILFAKNNGHIDYIKIACFCAKQIRKNMSGFDEICLITDSESNDDTVTECFDRVILDDNETISSTRVFRDTQANITTAPFRQMTRSDVYDITPYDETLVMDCDYIVMSDKLDAVWNSTHDFLIQKEIVDIAGKDEQNIVRLGNKSIDMFWATVFYFRKTEYTKNLFSMTQHIRDNYQYYFSLYNCEVKSTFRNDFAFSIAIHILNGEIDIDIPTMPYRYMFNSYDWDDIYKINENTVWMKCSSKQNPHKFNIVKFSNTDLHIMNKKSLEKHI